MPKTTSRDSDLSLLDSFWKERVDRTVLPNGLTLIVKPDASADLASVQVWVKTGSIHEGKNLGAGLSHYLEHMLFKGTDRRAGREISAEVQANGGNINAYTTFDRTVYYIDLPSEHVERAIDLLADSVLHSTLPADEVTREKDVILREIAMTQDDPDNRHWENLFSTAFRTHPYREPIIGHKDVFSAITREDLVGYYKARYVPNNMVVVVVGNVDPAAILVSVQEHFGTAPRAALAPVLVQDEAAPLAPRESHRFEDVEVARVAIAWSVPGLSHSDAPSLDLLGSVLGAGDSSVLWAEIREKSRLVHSIDASNWNPGTTGLFCVSFTCDADKRDRAIVAVETALHARLKKGFALADLKKVRRQAIVGEIGTRKTMSGQASRLGAAEVVVGDLDYSKTYFERLAKVTPADLVRVLKRYLVATARTTVSLNPAKAKVAAPIIHGRSVRADFEVAQLSNGARIVFQEDRRLPSVHLRVMFKGGPLWEEKGKRGATALLATLLAKDTRRRSAAIIAKRIEEVGGVFSGFAGNNSFGFMAETLSSDLDRALECLTGAYLDPAFKKQTFAIEQAAQTAGLLQEEDDVVSFARKTARQKFFGNHPLALGADGDVAGVKAVTPKDLAELYATLAVGPNTVVAVSGDFKASKLIPRLEALVRKGRSGKLAPTSAVWKGPAEVGDFVIHKPREQAVVIQAFPGSKVLDADYYIGEVADELFSGMASRLFERVREEKGLAYFIRSTRIIGLDAGMFAFFAGTQPGKETEVLAEIDAEIARVSAGLVEPVELARVQTRLKAGRRQSLQTNGARATQAGLNALQGQSVNDWKLYDSRISAVSINDLAEFAQAHFKKSARMQLIVRPKA